MRKKKEVCATTRLNKYIAEELKKSGLVYFPRFFEIVVADTELC